MLTYKPVVLSHQMRSDGTYNVKIRITHNRRSKYLPTNIIVRGCELMKNGDLKPNTPPMFKSVREIEELMNITSEIGSLTLSTMTVDDVVAYIKKRNEKERFNLDFFEYADRYIAGKSHGNGKTIRSAVNCFERYLGARRCDINEITGSMVKDFVSWYSKQPKYTGRGDRKKKMKEGSSAAKSVVRCLSSIFRAAKDEYNDDDIGLIRIPRNPFGKIRFDMVSYKGQDSLTVEDMQKMIDATKSRVSQQQALDIFILSFALMGMNPADLFEAPRPKGGELKYYRRKTKTRRADKAEMRVGIPPCIKDRLDRLGDSKELISAAIKGDDIYAFSCRVSHAITRLSSQVTGKTFSTYAARKTFATLARNECGIDKATVDECLDHVTQDMKLADVYIKRDWNRLKDVQEKVLNLFEW